MTTGLVLFYAFLMGGVCGLRSMTAPAVVAWGARLGWLHGEGGLLGFFAHTVTLVIFSLLAVGELVADKLSFIPGRTQPGPLGVRLIFGAACAAALCLAGGASVAAGVFLGALGALAGAFAGYTYRTRLGAKIPDLPLALLEDLIAVGGGFLIVSRF